MKHGPALGGNLHPVGSTLGCVSGWGDGKKPRQHALTRVVEPLKLHWRSLDKICRQTHPWCNAVLINRMMVGTYLAHSLSPSLGPNISLQSVCATAWLQWQITFRNFWIPLFRALVGSSVIYSHKTGRQTVPTQVHTAFCIRFEIQDFHKRLR